MKHSMVTQDVATFVSLGRAMALASLEGALDAEESAELSSALVAGILTGCMEFETYARVHGALADLLELTFQGEPGRPSAASPPPTPSRPKEAAEDVLGVYLEEAGQAWDKVTWDPETCRRVGAFVRAVFDVSRSQFGTVGWFCAPLRASATELMAAARAAGLLILSIEGAVPSGPTEAVLEDPEAGTGAAKLIIGWGERQTAVELLPLS
jgi:hypothetical protein